MHTQDKMTGAHSYQERGVALVAVMLTLSKCSMPGGGSTFKLHQIRYALITFGTALLILAVVLLLQQPGLPS